MYYTLKVLICMPNNMPFYDYNARSRFSPFSRDSPKYMFPVGTYWMFAQQSFLIGYAGSNKTPYNKTL